MYLFSHVAALSPYMSVLGFMVALPTTVATYYQSWKTRQESRDAREGLVFSHNCLEFALEDGTSINLVPLESLHSLPKPGDIVLLPGTGYTSQAPLLPGAYRVGRVEHIYAPVNTPRALPGQARLAKAVAHVEPLAAFSEA
jgi:hypothetical protein